MRLSVRRVLCAALLAAGVPFACGDPPGADDDENDDNAGEAGANLGGSVGNGGSSGESGGRGGTSSSGAGEAGADDPGSGGSAASAATGGRGGSGGVSGGSGGATGGSGGASGGSGGASGGSSGAASGTGGTGGASGQGGSSGSGGAAGAGTAGSGTGGSSGTGGTSGAGGVTGCAGQDEALCTTLKTHLRHRYRFEGTGTTVTDSIGTAHGVALNTTLTGTGALALAGGTSDQYVDLPNGIASSMIAGTFEAWVVWTGGSNWQRIFDFGTNVNGEGSQGDGTSYIFVSPSGDTTGLLRAAYTTQGEPYETKLTGSGPLPASTLHAVTVVVTDYPYTMALYQDGALVASGVTGSSLSGIADLNCWLGRSQYVADAEFQGSFEEFRIYAVALTDAEVGFSFASGPNPTFLDE